MTYDFKKAEADGLSRDTITSYLASKGRQAEADDYYGTPQRKQGAAAGIREDIDNRGEGMVKSIAADMRGEQNALRTGFQILGQGAGFGNDLLGRGFQAILPDAAEKAIGGAFEGVTKTSPVQSLLQAYGDFKEARPALARDLEAFGNVGSLLPWGTGARAAKTVTRGAVDATVDGGRKLVTNLAEKATDVADQQLVKDWNRTLNMSQRMRAGELKYGKNTPQFLAREGVLPIVDDKNFLDPSEALADLRLKQTAENAVHEDLLESTGRYASLDDMRENAVRNVTAMGTDRDTAIRTIDAEFEAYRRQYAARGFTDEAGRFQLPLNDINRIKQDAWSKSNFTALASPEERTRAGAFEIIGHSGKQVIERTVGEAAPEITSLNRRLGDIQEAIYTLTTRRGAPVKNRRIGKYAARLIGGLAGTSLGPLGVIGGAVTADAIVDILQNPKISIGRFSKFIRKASEESPEAVEAAIERIKVNRKLRESRRLLRAPKPLPPLGSEGNPIVAGPWKGGEPQMYTQSQIRDRLRDLEEIYSQLGARNRLALPAGQTREPQIPITLPSKIVRPGEVQEAADAGYGRRLPDLNVETNPTQTP